MIIRELTVEQVREELAKRGLSERSVPYRGYAVQLENDGRGRLFIGHSPDGRYLLQRAILKSQEAHMGVATWPEEN